MKDYLVVGIFIVLIAITFSMFKPTPIGNGSVVSPVMMDSFNWIRENTNEDDAILITTCSACSQKAIFYLTDRQYHLIWQKDYLSKISEAKIERNYLIDTFPIHFKFTKDLETGKILSQAIPDKVETDLCEYKYYYMDMLARNELATQYNAIFANYLVTENNFSLLYQNENIIIMENNNVGGECYNPVDLTPVQNGN